MADVMRIVWLNNLLVRLSSLVSNPRTKKFVLGAPRKKFADGFPASLHIIFL